MITPEAPTPDDVEYNLRCIEVAGFNAFTKPIRSHIAAQSQQMEKANRDAIAEVKLLCRLISDSRAEVDRLREALRKIATTHYCVYDGDRPYTSEHDSGYSLGVADGHRLAAKWANEALNPEQKGGV